MTDPNIPNSRFFGKNANGKAAQDLYNNDRPDYDRRRAEAERDGLLAPKPVWADPDYRRRYDPVQFTEDELKILGEIPETETNKYYRSQSNGGDDTLANLAADPKRQDHYAKVRAAAVLRGLVPKTQTPTAPEPRPVNTFFTLSDELADRANLPRGYQCNEAGLATVLKVIEDRKAQKIAADALAAKTQAQLERDRKADESAAEFGRLLEFNRQAAKQTT